MPNYERLSALDAAFLRIETPSCHMHVGVTLIFDAAPLRLEHGGIDIDRIRTFVAAGLQRVPRYRQRLDYVPLQRHPVWVDDESFNIHYHVRHAALPRPGSLRQLKRLAGRINSQKLDRSRPLWELWFVEGLEGDRFAVIAKIHHCMMDGASGVDVMAVLLRFDNGAAAPSETPQWSPRRTPSRVELLGTELLRQHQRAKSLLAGWTRFKQDPQQALSGLRDHAESMIDALGSGVTPASKTPLNPLRIGAYRRIDWTSSSLGEAKQIKNALGGKINDVVLAAVSGMLRSHFTAQGLEAVDALDYRVLMPVNVRERSTDGATRLGNRISMMVMRLPLETSDAADRLRAICDLTAKAKLSGQLEGIERATELGDWTAASLLSQGMRLATRIRAYNLVVTNIAGPPVPLYLLGCRLEEVYPMAPLYLTQALSVAVFSYAGKLFWGFNADWDQVPDLHGLTRLLEGALSELKSAAAAPASAPEES